MNHRHRLTAGSLAVVGFLGSAMPTGGLLLSAGALAALSGCSYFRTGSTTPEQVTADLTGAVNGAINVIPALAALNPPVLTPAQAQGLTDALQQARTLLASIGPDTPAQTAVGVLAKVTAYLDAFLAVLASSPLPPSAALIVAAISVVLPEVERYLASLAVPASPVVATMGAKASASGMSLSRARSTLKVSGEGSHD